MVAVVCKNKSRYTLTRHICGRVCVITVGSRVGRQRIRRALMPFGDGFVFSRGVHTRGFTPFDTSAYRTELLFHTFKKHVLSQTGLDRVVGIFDPDGQFLHHALPIINHCLEVKIVTTASADEFCEQCLTEIGTCPYICTEKNALLDCDICFAPEGLSYFGGELFGEGGHMPNPNDIALPSYCNQAIFFGADKIDLAALLCFEEPSLCPEHLIHFSKKQHLFV